MGAGESEVEDGIQTIGQLQQVLEQAQGEIDTMATGSIQTKPAQQEDEKPNEVEFVTPTEILGDLGKLCKSLEKVKEEKKEGYQINNSYEISGFNLKMK